MATGVSILAGANSKIQAGGTALSLITATQALLGFGNDGNLPDGISGFLFDIPQSEELSLNAQITDHFTQENYAIQDHIAISPAKITLTGEIGNLIVSQAKFLQFAQTLIDRLTPLGVLSPAQSQSTQQALTEINRLQSAAQSAITQYNNLSDAFSPNEAGTDPQQKAYFVLQGMFNSRQIVSVQTPWNTYQSMAIESLSFNQDAETKDKSTITVTCKEIRTVSANFRFGKLEGRIEAQSAPVTEQGPVKGDNTTLTGDVAQRTLGITPK